MRREVRPITRISKSLAKITQSLITEVICYKLLQEIILHAAEAECWLKARQEDAAIQHLLQLLRGAGCSVKHLYHYHGFLMTFRP